MAGTGKAEDAYVITFKGEALDKLKNMAIKLDIPETELHEVLEKGMRALELPDDGKLTFNKGGDQFFVDVKKL